MGTNLSLAEIKKIAKDMIQAYSPQGVDFPEEHFNYALANVLVKLHLSGLAKDLLNEVKNIRGD